jgi:hypothetical protein
MSEINRDTFLVYVKRAPFGNSLSPIQIEGLNRYLDYWESKYADKDIRWLAYILASVYHETGGHFNPIKETVMPYHRDKNPSDKEVIRRLDNAYRTGKLKRVKTPYWRQGWFGRGDIQITHEDNYIKFGLQGDPSMALHKDTAVWITFKGMTEGLFSPGNTLQKYFNGSKEDPKGARRIVNGVDKSGLIADYYTNFLGAIKASLEEEKPKDVTPEETKALEQKPMSEEIPTWVVAGGGVASGVISAVSSPWGVLSLALVLISVGVYLWYRSKDKREHGG